MGTWITEKMIEAYTARFNKGVAHSYEVWEEGKLVGGLYGIDLGHVFCGESMFSKVSQASKAALIVLFKHLKQRDFVLLDVQYMTEHLKMFGAIEISFEEYTKLLHLSYTRACEF